MIASHKNTTWAKLLLVTSVGKKLVMGATGLFLCIFLVVHLAGNLLLLKNDGGQAFNTYSEFMSHSKIIRLTEIFLFLGFLLHIADGILLTFQNKKARTQGYAVKKSGENSSWTSRTMSLSAFIVFLFLAVHLYTFFVKERLLKTHENMYTAVLSAFASLPYTLFYIFAMFFLAFHLHHGFQSSFQSLGLAHPKYTPLIKKTGLLFFFLIPLGFAFIAFSMYLKQGVP